MVSVGAIKLDQHLIQPPRSYNQYDVFPEEHQQTADEKLAQYEQEEEQEDKRTLLEDDEELEENDYL